VRFAFHDFYDGDLQLMIKCSQGAFTANADGSLVMATHPVIGSEFNDLENSSWLFIGFMLAGSATQSVVSFEFQTFACH
jgi:hypothetical protein